MGLQSEIGLIPRQPNAAQRAMQRTASAPAVAGFLAKALPPTDRLALRLTKGRVTIAGLLAALPVVVLTTTGAKSGESRTSPLNGIPYRDDLAFIGTRFGSGKTPNWAYNLRAYPEAAIEYNGRTVAVTAREADAAESDEVFDAGVRIYPGFAAYRERATNQIPVFILESATPQVGQ